VSGDDAGWIGRCLALGRDGAPDVPIGAVVVRGGEIVAEASNRVERDADPCAHAELLAIRAAAERLGRSRLDDCTLYVTVEPCTMCAGAIVLARIGRVVFGAWEPKTGAFGSRLDVRDAPSLTGRIEVVPGVLGAECAAAMRAFFGDLRSGPDRSDEGSTDS